MSTEKPGTGLETHYGAASIELGRSSAVVSAASTDSAASTASDDGLQWLPDQKRSTTPLKFSGSGSEYFKIWIVNLALIVLTLGIYTPWAKVRRLKYFYNHTTIAGDALDFHGDPKKMLRGTAFAGVFLLLYSNAAAVSLAAGLIAAAAFVALWPLMWWASLRFRLAHTSWRGMRFAFVGDKATAWRVMGVPLLIILLPLSAITGVMADMDSAKGQPGATTTLPTWAMIAAGVAFIGVALLPYFLYGIKAYQHGNYKLGQLRTELRTTATQAYQPFLMVFGLGVVGVIAFVALLMMMFKAGSPIGAIVVGFVGYVLLIFAPWAYLAARLQNLWWSRTGNRYLRFRSGLSAVSYLGLVLKNFLLTVITLGLYRPFAAVNLWRARVEAVSIVSRVEFESLASRVQRQFNDAAGDMGADLVGLDVGW
jgi:uncharacterized membrane protein YjgN (DUF898 family)